MASAVAVREPAKAELSEVSPPPPDVNFGDLLALAKELVPTGFLPDHVKTPGQCAAIILTGRELGMGPMRALRSLQMVKGKVVENADSQLARFKRDGGRAVFDKLSDTEAALRLRHPNGDEHTETFTTEDARRAGLIVKGGSWEKYPKAMLRSRAITAGLKSVGWEGGVGAYDPDEATAFGPVPIAAPTTETVSASLELSPLERALEYPLPGKDSAWGGFGGQPLQLCSINLLRAVAEWVQAKVDQEPNDRLQELLTNVTLVLEARESGEVSEPLREPGEEG